MRALVENYILLFFVTAMLGWVMEVVCKLIQFHRFINRGFLIGPYCPIYGFGSVLITLLLSRYAESPVVVFLMGMIICGTLEYLTSYLMEKLFHARWWDYSQKRFNLNGRVCANTLIPFGLLGLGIIYGVKPFLFGLFAMIPQTAMDILCSALTAIILTDAVISTTVLGKIRHTAELTGGDDTETITRAASRALFFLRVRAACSCASRSMVSCCCRARWCAARCALSPMPSCITSPCWSACASASKC